MSCSKRETINLSYLRPHFSVSSRLPAFSQNLPSLISNNIFKNLKKFENLRLKDFTNFDFDPNDLANKPIGLDYVSLVEGKGGAIKSGEFGLHPTIKFHQERVNLQGFQIH